MSPELLLFAVGGLLLITGLLGGGFELRELKIPQVGRVARVLATGAGGACILLGIGMVSVAADTEANRGGTSVAAGPTSAPVHFRIRDQLGDYQVSEVATVIVDGRRLPDLTVTESDRDAVIDAAVDTPGRHDYTVAVTSLEVDDDGNTYEVSSSGQGSIMIGEGASFAVSYTQNGDDRDLTLVQE